MAEVPGAPNSASGAESRAVGGCGANCGPSCACTDQSADLRALAEAWPRLPEAVKAGILAMVKASKGD
jgi:hypothetical protein